MKSFIVLTVICLHLKWSFGTPVGVSSFAYQDSSGNSITETREFSRSGERRSNLTPLHPLRAIKPFLKPLPPLRPLRLFRPRHAKSGSGSGDFGNFGNMFNSANSAFAGGFAAPGFTHQIAAISPPNPNNPNVNVFERFNEGSAIPGANFVSMKSTAYSSSSNINGKEISNRGSETVVNNNGKVTGYSVHS
ncbi:uncharacterized protein LOC128677963 isoform X4 [Plodia interpunctella]|uniref:uncharacterized protein LOC128677963 isoform X4 n=1 Tax=Plodia interpunctella TaxID=58824 RepID=UPI002367E1F1|nr:uncharacterized protein LOC128677963 isoform X4 [Plodia interpunctella]